MYARLQVLPFSADLPAPELRRSYESLSFFLNAGAPSLPHIEERTIAAPSGRRRVRIYDPGTAAPAPTVVLLHGGGWMFGTIDSYDGFARQIAKRSGMRCLSVEYALAPEHPFPAALEDCIAAVRWAASEEGASLGIDHERIALIGDSAGANLALAVCLALRDAGVSLVRGAVLAYGCYSLELDTPSARAHGSGRYFLSIAEIRRYWICRRHLREAGHQSGVHAGREPCSPKRLLLFTRKGTKSAEKQTIVRIEMVMRSRHACGDDRPDLPGPQPAGCSLQVQEPT